MADSESVRAVVHSKSNLSTPGVSLAFTFDPVSGFTWLGEYDISADELLGNKKRRSESQFAKAQRFIETTLANGPVASTDILQAAEEQGISHKTLNRAKDAMGVHCFKQGRAWYWELPIDVEFTEVRQEGQDTQDGQDRRTNGGQEKPMAILSALTMLSNGTEG